MSKTEVKITLVDKIRLILGFNYTYKTRKAIAIETERAYAEFQEKLKKTAAKVKAEAKPASKSVAKRVAIQKAKPSKDAENKKPAAKKAPAKPVAKAPAAKKPTPKKGK